MWPEFENPSQSQPLAFFNDFFVKGKFNRYKEAFLDQSSYELVNGQPVEIDTINESIIYYAPLEGAESNDEGPEYDFTNMPFSERLEKLIRKKHHEAKSLIRDGIHSLQTEYVRNEYINTLCEKISKLYNLVDSSSEYRKYDINLRVFFRLLEFIMDEYPQLIKPNHISKVRHILNRWSHNHEQSVVTSEVQPFSFKHNSSKKNDIQNTIRIIEEVYLTSSSKGNLEEILFAKDLDKLQPRYTVQFDCNTIKASIILQQLEEYFTNLGPRTIDQSKRFMSKKGTFLKEGNISKSRTSPNSDGVRKEINEKLTNKKQ